MIGLEFTATARINPLWSSAGGTFWQPRSHELTTDGLCWSPQIQECLNHKEALLEIYSLSPHHQV